MVRYWLMVNPEKIYNGTVERDRMMACKSCIWGNIINLQTYFNYLNLDLLSMFSIKNNRSTWLEINDRNFSVSSIRFINDDVLSKYSTCKTIWNRIAPAKANILTFRVRLVIYTLDWTSTELGSLCNHLYAPSVWLVMNLSHLFLDYPKVIMVSVILCQFWRDIPITSVSIIDLFLRLYHVVSPVKIA